MTYEQKEEFLEENEDAYKEDNEFHICNCEYCSMYRSIERKYQVEQSQREGHE